MHDQGSKEVCWSSADTFNGDVCSTFIGSDVLDATHYHLLAIDHLADTIYIYIYIAQTLHAIEKPCPQGHPFQQYPAYAVETCNHRPLHSNQLTEVLA